MATKTYDCYVRLSYVSRDERLIPASRAFRADDPDFPGGWHDLVTDNTLVVWLVERSTITNATNHVLAHLAGHAPVGVTKLYDRKDPPKSEWGPGIKPVSNCGQEGRYMTKGGVVNLSDL